MAYASFRIKLTEQDMEDGKYFKVTIENFCPICMKPAFIRPLGLVPIGRINGLTTVNLNKYIFKAECPICGESFASIFADDNRIIGGQLHSGIWFCGYLPQKPTFSLDVPPNITLFSPRFLDIAKQANIAYTENLHELAGFGFRKALEFLVKDYLISISTSEHQERIAKLKLYEAIAEIGDPDIETLMHGLRIGGNDETHYQKKYDFSVDDLKSITESIIFLIDAKMKIDQAKASISAKLNLET